MLKRHPQGPLGAQAPPGRHVRSPCSSASRSSSGTLVLGDTLEPNFDTLFTDANAGTDAVVRSATRDPGRRGRDRARPDRRASVVDTRPPRSTASPRPSRRSQGFGQLVGKDGEDDRRQRPADVRRQLDRRPRAQPVPARRGPRAARRADEVVINRGAAEDGDLHVGDTTIARRRPSPSRSGSSASRRSATRTASAPSTFAGVHARRRAAAPDRTAPDEVSSIQSCGPSRASAQAELARRICGRAARRRRGDHAATSSSPRTSTTSTRLPRRAAHVPASSSPAIALLVATFSIYNTFSIIVAQRTRESALLRALGATRGQVLGSVVVEALVVGVVASVAGLFGGIGIATAAQGAVRRARLRHAARRRPRVQRPRTIVLSRSVGVVVTLVAAVAAGRAGLAGPAAGRAPRRRRRPRSVRLGRSRRHRRGPRSGSAWSRSSRASRRGGDLVLARPAVGALLTARRRRRPRPGRGRAPASAVLGAPLARLRGVTGALARQNAMRNPRRTAATASALMVGVARGHAVHRVRRVAEGVGRRQRVAVVRAATSSSSGSGFGGSGLSPELAGAVRDLPEVDDAVGLGVGGVLVDGDARRVTSSTRRAPTRSLDLDVDRGSVAAARPDRARRVDRRHGRRQRLAARRRRAGHVRRRHDRRLRGRRDLRRRTTSLGELRDVDGRVGAARSAGRRLVVLVEARATASTPTTGARSVQRAAEQFGAPDVQDAAGVRRHARRTAST